MTNTSASLPSKTESPAKPDKPQLSPERIEQFVADLIGEDVHARRVFSLGRAVVGLVHSATLGIHAIGRGLADAMGLDPKHSIKQVDRLLSNAGITVWDWFARWVLFVVADRKQLLVALDWTNFEDDAQQTIALYLVTSHGRATPLLWKTVLKSELLHRRASYEMEIIDRLNEILPPDVDVIVLADRGFGDHKFFEKLQAIEWLYVIRIQQKTKVIYDGTCKPAGKWVPLGGNARILKSVLLTDKKKPIPAVVVKHQKGMKEAWCLATNHADLNAAEIVKLYARRFTIEETFRDIKDNHFGMGLKLARIGKPERRDRLLLLAAISQALLTLLGAAGEACGLDRTLKANTTKKRTMSLYNQGVCWFRAIPNMREERLQPLMRAFAQLIQDHAAFREILGVI